MWPAKKPRCKLQFVASVVSASRVLVGIAIVCCARDFNTHAHTKLFQRVRYRIASAATSTSAFAAVVFKQPTNQPTTTTTERASVLFHSITPDGQCVQKKYKNNKIRPHPSQVESIKSKPSQDEPAAVLLTSRTPFQYQLRKYWTTSIFLELSSKSLAF